MTIAARPESPLQPEAVALIEALDAYLGGLYPPEHNHLLDPAALAGPDVRFLVARLDGRAVGCAALRLSAGYGEVKRLFVSPQARGLGIGRALMAALEGQARAEGVTELRMETGRSQPEALGLFAAAGFTPCPVFGDYAENGDSVFLAKPL